MLIPYSLQSIVPLDNEAGMSTMFEEIYQQPLPTEAQAWIRRVITHLSYTQDWCGPSFAVVESEWREVLTRAYWLYTVAQPQEPFQKVISAALSLPPLPDYEIVEG